MSAVARSIALSVTLSGLSRLFGRGAGGDLAGVVDFAVAADEAGVDQIVVPDHLAIGPRTDRYPFGRFPYPPEEPWLEPLTTLAAVAGATSRVRLGTGILIAPLRPPLLLAKTVATLDVLSRGRLDLGVGLGWQPEEFAGGPPFEGRGARLDDQLRACRALWREAPASFSSPSVSFEELWCLPHPVQPGGPPLWFGTALSPRNVARMVEFDAGWAPVGDDVTELAAGVETLRAAFAAAGKDPDLARVRANVPVATRDDGRPDLERTLANVAAVRDAGADVAAFALARFVGRPERIRPFLDTLAEARRTA